MNILPRQRLLFCCLGGWAPSTVIRVSGNALSYRVGDDGGAVMAGKKVKWSTDRGGDRGVTTTESRLGRGRGSPRVRGTLSCATVAMGRWLEGCWSRAV
jgi:hypothetical protein